MRANRLILLLLIVLGCAACAPDDLDITPSPTPSSTPTPAPTRDAAASATPVPEVTAEAVSGETTLLDAIVAAVPRRMPAGSVQWQRTDTDVARQTIQSGVSARLEFSEPGGGQAEVTYIVFPTAEAAQSYYDTLRTGSIWTDAETDDQFPQPNAFVRGTNQSAILLLADQNIFVRLNVPRLSTSAGEPLVPLMHEALAVIDSAQSG